MILAASTEAAAATEAALSIGPVYWAWFIGAVLIFLALDLGVFHRKPHAVGFGEALMWTSIWFSMSMAFAFWIAPAMVGEQWTGDHTKLFITGYVVELSLSMDNVFVIALIFSFFRVPAEFQHRVLFWGILGALIMRAVMILLGASLIHQFHWILYLFGAFLLITGIKMLFAGDEEVAHKEEADNRVDVDDDESEDRSHYDRAAVEGDRFEDSLQVARLVDNIQ